MLEESNTDQGRTVQQVHYARERSNISSGLTVVVFSADWRAWFD